MELKRSSGVLLHITSLPANEGIGTLGKPAFEFVNWLKAAGQKYWQVLPIHPTGYADSPYQSPSAFAGNPLLIDLWELVELGLLAPDDIKGREYGEDPSTVDYEKVIAQKKELLRKKNTLTQATYEFYFENDLPKRDNILKKQFDSAVKIIEKLIEAGVENGEFLCEDCEGTARNIMFVLEGLKISAQTIGVTAEAVDREILYLLRGLGVEE